MLTEGFYKPALILDVVVSWHRNWAFVDDVRRGRSSAVVEKLTSLWLCEENPRTPQPSGCISPLFAVYWTNIANLTALCFKM